MIVVTGGAGFIGSNIVRGLNQIGRSDILIADNLKNGAKHLNLNALSFADYVDKDDLFDALRSMGSVDAIFHQGACSDTTERDGRFMMKNNYEYSKALLHEAEWRGAKFIYASSAAVYGAGLNGFREDPVCEYPLNVYGFSKLCFDNYVRRRMATSRSQIVGLRYFNVYGPQERHKARMASVAMHLFDQLTAELPMKLFEGSSEFLRDFVYVADAVRVNLFFLGSSACGIFNCGSGEARSFVDIAEQLMSLHGAGELEHILFPADLAGKYQRFTQADLAALRRAGYEGAFTPLKDGVALYYRALRENNGYLRPES